MSEELREKIKSVCFRAHSIQPNFECLQCEAILDLIESEGAELERLRKYCMLTFGDSHPEIKKCPHEMEVEELKAENERLKAKYKELEEILDDNTCPKCEEDISYKKLRDKKIDELESKEEG